jgi:hypothetical protein
VDPDFIDLQRQIVGTFEIIKCKGLGRGARGSVVVKALCYKQERLESNP